LRCTHDIVLYKFSVCVCLSLPFYLSTYSLSVLCYVNLSDCDWFYTQRFVIDRCAT